MPAIESMATPSGTYADELRLRVRRLGDLLARVQPVPTEWLVEGKHKQDRIEPEPCSSWAELEAAWAACQRWRQSIGDMLSVMLSVACSTSQTGNQLHLLVIAPAGSMKTTLADAMLTSRKCIVVENITGFYSGMVSDDGRDLSFLARANHLTWITPEGDVLVNSPQFQDLMAQARRIFDGKGSAKYKNSDEDKSFEGLRTPWIIAGTPFMIDYWDQSRLGDRFLRVTLDEPVQDERRAIVLAAMRNEWSAVAEHSNGTSGGVEAKLRRAYAMTGGYVEWLRANVDKIDRVEISQANLERVADLAEFTADMRAKPNTDTKKLDCHDSKELPTRLGRQLVRLARCMSLVLNRWSVDADVMRRVHNVALDTSRGRTLDVLKWFRCVDAATGRTYQESSGIMAVQLARWAAFRTEPECLAYLNFLLKIGVLEHVASPHSHGHWKMTRRCDELHRAVVGGG